MSEIMSMPINKHAEWSVLAQMLQKPDRIGEVIGIPIEQQDFSDADTRLLYATIVERYYAGHSVDPLIVGEMVRDDLADLWGLPDNMAVTPHLVDRIRSADLGGDLLDHAGIVRKLSSARQLQTACFNAIQAINEGKLTPEEIGDQLSAEALQITAGSVKRTEVLDWMDTGRQYVQQLKRVIAAKQQGIEIGVYTGFPFVDDFTSGIGPGELCFLAGDPGVGKTALAWACALGFVQRQMTRDPDKRVGTLMLSMEMGLYSSTMRVVSALTGINSTRLREGDITERELMHILREWKNREGQPIFFNFASNFRLSQMRALISEAIRRANVGFVVIDHFRMIDTDRRFTNPNQEDENKVRFLKENIAKDLNVAVMCLAHTVKVGARDSPRPRLSDLRGSGQVAAHADFVGFLWKPGAHMSEEARFEMDVDMNDMELVWEKNRYGAPEAAPLRFEPTRMEVLPR